MHFVSSNQAGTKLNRFLFPFVIAAAVGFQPHAYAAGPIEVMLLDGESGGPYHAWGLTTPVLKKELEETGLFHVDVVTALASGGDLSAFKPDFGRYRFPACSQCCSCKFCLGTSYGE